MYIFFSVGLKLVFILRQEWIKHILSRPEEFPRGEFLPKFFPLLGKGLLTSTGEMHRFQKRILSKAFSNQQLQSYVPIFDKHAEDFVKVNYFYHSLLLLTSEPRALSVRWNNRE